MIFKWEKAVLAMTFVLSSNERRGTGEDQVTIPTNVFSGNIQIDSVRVSLLVPEYSKDELSIFFFRAPLPHLPYCCVVTCHVHNTPHTACAT